MESTFEGAIIDEVWMILGWWGRYQRVQFLMTILPVVVCALHVMSVVFIGRAVQHRCAPVTNLKVSITRAGVLQEFDVFTNTSELNLTVEYKQCSIDVINGTETILSTNCQAGYLYSEPKDRSFVSQWDLVCEQESLSDVSQTFLSLGMLLGAFVFTYLSDKFGRKPIYMIAHLLLLIVAGVIALSPNFLTFLILRFFLGGLQQGTGLVSNILLLELLPKDRRALPSQVGSILWPGALLLLCLIGYGTRDVSWQYSELIFAACSFYVLFQWWITDESLRWLVVNKREVEARRLLEKAARINKVDVSPALALLTCATSEKNLLQMTPPPGSNQKLDLVSKPHNKTNATSKEKVQKTELGLLAFVKNKHLLRITVISWFMWFTDSVTYYGLLMTSQSISDDLYLGFFLSVLVEFPAGFAYTFFINRIGRKRCLFIFHLLGAISLLAATILTNVPGAESMSGMKTVTLCISLVGRFGITTGFSVLWLYTAELFPTNVRNTGFGVCALAARVALMLSPYTRTLARQIPWGPGTVFVILCLLLLLLLRYLPETHGQELPQTLEDMEKLFKSQDKTRTSGRVSAAANEVV